MIRIHTDDLRVDNRNFRRSLFALLMLAILTAGVHGQNEPNDENNPVILPPKNVVFKFVDSNNQPIEGVSIQSNSLVYAGNSGGSFGASLVPVDRDKSVSSAEGKLECSVPDMRLGDLVRMRLETEHEEFVPFDDWLVISEGVTQVTLQRGVKVAATAIDSESKQPIKDNLFGIAQQNNYKQLKDWKLMQNGMLISPSLPTDAHRIRLVEIVDGKPKRFSDPIDIQQQDGAKKMLKVIPMHQAITLKGKLSPQIPRPIKNGQINICVAWNEEKDLKFGDEAGHWFDQVEIDEAGQFEISGIPSGDWLQLIATCDGWVSQASPKELRMAVYPALDNRVDATVLPLILSLKNLPAESVVEMVPRRTVSIEVLDEADKPVKNLEVSIIDYPFISNGTWGRITKDELIASREKRDFNFQYQRSERRFTTDENGIATIPEFFGNKFRIFIRGYEIIHSGFLTELKDNKKTIKIKPDGDK